MPLMPACLIFSPHISMHQDPPCVKTPIPCTDLTSSGLTYPLGTAPRPMLLLEAHKHVLISFRSRRKKINFQVNENVLVYNSNIFVFIQMQY